MDAQASAEIWTAPPRPTSQYTTSKQANAHEGNSLDCGLEETQDK